MFVIVMFFVNPLIDSKDGSGVLKLQLAFHKEEGVEIINLWGKTGRDNFRTLIFTDSIYAFAYSLFLGSLISFLSQNVNKRYSLRSFLFVLIAFSSGGLDILENTMELSFINNPSAFADNWFFLHSVAALLKWLAVIVVVIYVGILFARKIKLVRKFI
jgi:hypothetical protein